MKAVEAQANKQEDKKDVPGETADSARTHTWARSELVHTGRSFALTFSG